MGRREVDSDHDETVTHGEVRKKTTGWNEPINHKKKRRKRPWLLEEVL